MKLKLLTLTEQALLRFSNKSFGNRKGISLLRNRNISSNNLSFNKDLKHKTLADIKSKNTKKNKQLRTNEQTTENDDVYILNGRVFPIQGNRKQQKDESTKESMKGKSFQVLENLQNYAKESTSYNNTKISNNNDTNSEIYKNEKEDLLHTYKENNIGIHTKDQNSTSVEKENTKAHNVNESNDPYKTLEASIEKESRNTKKTQEIQTEVEESTGTKSTQCYINETSANVKIDEEDKSPEKANEPKEIKEPSGKRQIKNDIYEILKEINNENDKKEVEKFLNFLLLYKNNSTISVLGNAISFYFCNILSEDLKDLKTYYREGARLSAHTFFSTLRELNEVQLSKMMNIYLKEYFSKIFHIFRENKINLHFENLEIHNIKLLGIYNIIGIIRNEGKRIKKEHIKKFLYQYICIDDQNLALFKSNNRMKFLGNIIKNGTTTRMHLLLDVSFDLLTYDSTSSDLITSTKFRNVLFEFLLENELTNPNFSMQPYEVINLKASGWSLVDVNNILSGNNPYE